MCTFNCYFYEIFNSFTHGITDPSQMERGDFLVGMATCHSLTIIDGEISGDPMDVIMFNATKWVSLSQGVMFILSLRLQNVL